MVVIGAIIFGAYYLGKNQNEDLPLTTSESSTPTTATDVTEKSPTADKPASAPAPDENTIIVAAVREALVAELGPDANSIEISVSKIQGDFASGYAGGEGGGGMWFVAKVDGKWEYVWGGNGTVSCSDLTPYPDYPADMIPECWDEATQQLVIR